MGVEGGGVDRTWIKAFKGLKKFSGWQWWWSPSENSVCPCPLCQFYDSFTPVYIGQDGLSGTPVFVSLRRFTFVGRDVF